MHLFHKYDRHFSEFHQCACGKMKYKPYSFYVGYGNELAEKLMQAYLLVEKSNKVLKETGEPTHVITIEKRSTSLKEIRPFPTTATKPVGIKH